MGVSYFAWIINFFSAVKLDFDIERALREGQMMDGGTQQAPPPTISCRHIIPSDSPDPSSPCLIPFRLLRSAA